MHCGKRPGVDDTQASSWLAVRLDPLVVGDGQGARRRIARVDHAARLDQQLHFAYRAGPVCDALGDDGHLPGSQDDGGRAGFATQFDPQFAIQTMKVSSVSACACQMKSPASFTTLNW